MQTAVGTEPVAAGKTIYYARVSSHDQAARLQTQASRPQKHYVDFLTTPISASPQTTVDDRGLSLPLHSNHAYGSAQTRLSIKR